MKSEAIYLDTNVIMDFLLGRDSSAFDLLQKTILCKYSVVISNVVLEELKYQNLLEEGGRLISLLKSINKISVVLVSEEDKKDAKKILFGYKTHYNDALHKVIAVKANVSYFVTKNIRHFICFEDLDVKTPDEL